MPSIARRRRLLEANHGRCLAGNDSGVDGDAAHFVMLLADRPPATRLRSLAPWVAARWPPGPLPNSLTCASVRSLSTGGATRDRCSIDRAVSPTGVEFPSLVDPATLAQSSNRF